MLALKQGITKEFKKLLSVGFIKIQDFSRQPLQKITKIAFTALAVFN